MKGNLQNRENIFLLKNIWVNIQNKGLISRIYKDLLKLNNKKNQIIQLKKWAKNPSFLQRWHANGQHGLKRCSVISNQRHVHQWMNKHSHTHTHTYTYNTHTHTYIHTHTMEYYSVSKRKGFWHMLQHGWWTLRTLFYMKYASYKNTSWFHLHAVSKIVKFLETESTVVVIEDWGKGKNSTVSDLRDEKVLEICFRTMWIYLTLELFT